MPILAANKAAVEMFLAVQTQWSHAGQWGLPVGLNYPAVEAAMNMMAIERRKRPELLIRVRIMEAAALPGYRARIVESLKRR